MQATLVVPPPLAAFDWSEYLGLGYLAAVARQNGYSVDIIDCRFENLHHENAVQKIQALNPHIVGITSSFAVELVSAVELAQALRDAGYDGLIVVGGHPSTFAFHSLLSRFPAINIVVRGEGEITFLELLRCLDRNLDWRRVPGIAYRENSQVTTTQPRTLVADLDSLPFPVRDNLATNGMPASVVRARAQRFSPGTFILSSRGCPFNCSFCSVQAFYGLSPGRKWRARTAKNVVEEMASLVEKWGVQHFRFSDDNFFGSCRKGKVRGQELATLLLEMDLNVSFDIECRVTDVEFSILSLLKRAGLSKVNLGIESGVPRVLKTFNKHTTVEQNKKAVSILKELGLKCHPNFIFIDPDTTLEELRLNFVFFKDTRIYQAPRLFGLLYGNRLGLFAGTAILEQYQAAGRTKPWKYSGFTDEQQRILTDLGAVLDYEMKDPEVVQFLRLHNRVLIELKRRNDNLERLREQLRISSLGVTSDHSLTDCSDLLSSMERWLANIGTFTQQLFEQALVRAEQGAIKDETIEQHLQDFLLEIDRYDVRHFGKTTDELMQVANVELAAIQS